ncbi:MAG: AmmeMemoRadiSam system protein A, partial [Rhodospirillales bacterium]
IDKRTATAIAALDPGRIERAGACGRFPVGGLLHLAKARGMTVETIDLKNSGDTAGNKDRVVGYGAWAFFEPPATKRNGPVITVRRKEAEKPAISAQDFEARTRQLLVDHGDRLLEIADTAIRYGLKHNQPMPSDLAAEPPALQANGACFVTLKTATLQLRGCIGSPVAHQPLALDVARNAYKAAFNDPRFKPVGIDEFETLRLSISVLSPQAAMPVRDEADLLAQLRPGIDGLVIADGGKRALFLPSVWEQLPDPEQFLAHLKQKAGMARNHWSPSFRANRFITEEIHAKH